MNGWNWVKFDSTCANNPYRSGLLQCDGVAVVILTGGSQTLAEWQLNGGTEMTFNSILPVCHNTKTTFCRYSYSMNSVICRLRWSVQINFHVICLFWMSRCIFHLSSRLWHPWTTIEAAVCEYHNTWTGGTGVGRPYRTRQISAAGEWSLCGWDPNKCFIRPQSGWRTSWALPRRFSDHPQLWGQWQERERDVPWGLLLSQRISKC